MKQLVIDLPYRPALGRADFLMSQCNAEALAGIERWPDWPSRCLVLHGPEGCGKSHLVHLWRERSTARVVEGPNLDRAEALRGGTASAIALDDADRAPETALLHLFNACAEQDVSLLIVARYAPSAWPIALPDLASRLRAAPAIGIDRPDDPLLAAILVKHFADRQLRVGPGVIGYLVPRMERSFAAAAALAARLDRLALAAGRPVGIALARRALAELGA